jgi:hypothetical protein
MRIGLTIRVNPRWAGGTYYVLTWLRALNALPPQERPNVVLLHASAAGEAEAQRFASEVSGVMPMSQVAKLGLDFVYPGKRSVRSTHQRALGRLVAGLAAAVSARDVLGRGVSAA